MPITELALLHLKSHLPSPIALTHLHHARTTQSHHSSHPVHFFTQIEDPSYIYLLSTWDSIAQHEEWIFSEQNQKLLRLLEDEVEVVWMGHMQGLGDGEVSFAPVVGVGRYFVDERKKEGFEGGWGEVRHHLEEHTRPYSMFEGWKVEEEEGVGEFVLLSGWNEVEEHYGFAKTDGFKEFGRIRECLVGAEIKHMRKWEN